MDKRKQENHSGKVRQPLEGEVLGQVIETLGNRMLLVRCVDGVTRKVRISGKHRFRMWVNRGDVIALTPHYGMNEERGTMVYRYKKRGKRLLNKQKLIPDEYVY